jgi:hypothetical protein
MFHGRCASQSVLECGSFGCRFLLRVDDPALEVVWFGVMSAEIDLRLPEDCVSTTRDVMGW